MTKRFKYLFLSANELRDALEQADMAPATFCRLTGASMDDMSRWLDVGKPMLTPPHWVTVMLDLFKEHPSNIVQARITAAEMIVLDKNNPERGEFPYQKGNYDD